jgi:hypothetical protein
LRSSERHQANPLAEARTSGDDVLTRGELLRRLRRKERHGAPECRCECGIYATNLDNLELYLDDIPTISPASRVLGLVSLWGTVVECERGFRASHAYPLRVYVPADQPSKDGFDCAGIVDGLSAYGVTVELLAARCKDAPAMLRQQAA